jgi:hypothetical protein
MAGGWRKLYSEELHNLYTSQNIIQVIKSRRMSWGGHVTHMRDTRNAIFWLENLKGRILLEDIGIDGKIILDWILGK